VLKVSRSAFYDWLKRPVSTRQQDDDNLVVKIKISHKNSRDNYGTRRIKDDLQDDGDQVSRRRISRLMAQEALESTHKKKFKITTDSRHALPISPNLLNRDFEPDQPDRAYVSDITYSVPGAQGKHGCLNEPRVYLKYANELARAEPFVSMPGCAGI
jgi:putative transposase